MNRRNLIKTFSLIPIMGLTSKQVLAQDMRIKERFIKPDKLSKGDKVTIIAPSTAVSSPDDYFRAVEILEKLNLKHEFAPNVKNGTGYKTRSIKERVEDFHYAFESDSKAVLCLRGGYGSASMLDSIDFSLVLSNPKVFVAYSDVTAIHLALNARGMVTFHGPILLSHFDLLTFKSFKNAFFGYNDKIFKNPEGDGIREPYPIIKIREGIGAGKLVGGNLSLISSLEGSDYAINTKGNLLFIEDVGEEPYRIHRMLTQLKINKKLENLHGVIIGKCNDCERKSTNTWDQSELEVYFDMFSEYDYPVMYGLMAGHTSPQLTLPLNIDYELDTREGYLKILEKVHN